MNASTRPESCVGITVVVPSFNQGRFIDDALQSVLRQNYPRLELIVMDGGSTDDTTERLKTYGDRIQWVSAKDEGQTDAIIKGFARAQHSWLTWLNSDDVQCNDALWAVDETIQAHPEAEVIVGRGHYMDEEGENPRPYPTIQLGPAVDVKRAMFEKGYMAQPSVYFRKDAYAAVGGLNAALNFCMDYDLWARFALHGAKFVGIDRDISGNRWYDTTKTSAQLLDLLAQAAARQAGLFGRVSPYFVQGISDNLYSRLHSVYFGDAYHVMFRWLYFKSVWVWLNARSPWYCVKGLLAETIAKSGPVVNDKLTLRDWVRGFRKIASRMWRR